MIIFTYQTSDEYAAALRVIQRLGVDHEAQSAELTIIAGELTAQERAQIAKATKPISDDRAAVQNPDE